MADLKNKSEINFVSSKLLMDNTYFAPSVHCSYYSVLQLMKFTIKDAFGTSYDKQGEEINLLKQNKATAKGTHEYLIYKISKQLKEVQLSEYSDFNRKIKDLKILRIKGDYDNVAISSEQSQKAYRYANDLRKQLKKIFKV